MKFTKPSLRNLLTKFVKDTDSDTPCFNKSNEAQNNSGNRNNAVRNSEQNSSNQTRENSNNQARENGNNQTRENGRGAPETEQRGPRCRGNDSNMDLGNAPYAFDIESATGSNNNYRTALWTGKHLQLTVMSIPVGEETGVEIHNDLDQFIRIESGTGRVEMGRLKSNMNYKIPLDSRYAVLIPAGTYHNIINTGRTPLKLYSIYTPKAHPFGTVDATKADSERRENS